MDALLLRLQHALAGRYAVEHELGRGGMAIVYLGRDLRLERRVAIKLFERDDDLSSGGERFLREIRIAAQLQHPNILPVFESGEFEGLIYYIMPYVAGGSLRERLEREGPLPVGDAIRIAREVAEALEHAHQAGIVHRDIKPGNILLASGVAVVADFGIARALEESGMRVTDTGLAIGTPAYMSPEQASANPQVDGRSDVYALGCVLYEMLTGTPPFSGTTSRAVMARHAADSVPPIDTVRPVSLELQNTVLKALAKLPGDRWPTARSFAEALTAVAPAIPPTTRGPRRRRRVLALLAAAAILVLIALPLVRPVTNRLGARSEIDALPSIAVLPFVLIGDSSNSHIASGLTEALITGLVRVGGLRVPGQSRVSRFEGRVQDPQAIGRELGVHHVLTATVQVEGQRLRVIPRVVRVSDRENIWSDHFDGSMVDIFAMQDSITHNIVNALQVRLRSSSAARYGAGSRTHDPQAYDLYLRGRQGVRKATLEGAQEALGFFERAVARDSSLVDGWVGIAAALDWISQFAGRPPIEVVGRLRHAVERAAQLDSLHPLGVLQRARYRLYYEWDFEGYDRAMRQAIAMYPDNAELHLIYGQDLHIFGLYDSALAENRRASALDPTDAFTLANVAYSLFLIGRIEEARPIYERVLSLDSAMWWVPTDRAMIAASQGRHADAANEIEKAHRILGDLPWFLPYVVGCSRLAQPATASAAMARLLELAREQYVQPFFIGHARLFMGDRAGALDGLEASFHARDRDLINKVGVGEFEALRGEPRYEAILRSTGLDRYMRPPEKMKSRGLNQVVC